MFSIGSCHRMIRAFGVNPRCPQLPFGIAPRPLLPLPPPPPIAIHHNFLHIVLQPPLFCWLIVVFFCLPLSFSSAGATCPQAHPPLIAPPPLFAVAPLICQPLPLAISTLPWFIVAYKWHNSCHKRPTSHMLLYTLSLDGGPARMIASSWRHQPPPPTHKPLPNMWANECAMRVQGYYA
jgi:hypothetical protein